MLTDEQLQIQGLARSYAEEELRPRAADWDARRDLDEDVFEKLSELGFMGMLVPEEFGGLGFDLSTYLVVLEELARGDASVARTVALHNGSVATLLAEHGSQEQRSRWLAELAAGAVLGTYAFPEAPLDVDRGPVPVRAEPERGGWRLAGRAQWVTNGARAAVVALLAYDTDGVPGVFLVPTAAEGYRPGDRARTMGLRAAEIVTVELDDVRVGDDALLGALGAGREQLARGQDLLRLGTAALALGVGRAAMEHAVEYALGREQFGEPIAHFGAIQEKLAGMAGRLAGARALAQQAAAFLQGGSNGTTRPRHGLHGATARAAMAKLAASQAATWAADEAVQVFGGYGYMRHYPVERLLRDAKSTEIDEGTSEVLRNVIAAELLRDVEGRTESQMR